MVMAPGEMFGQTQKEKNDQKKKKETSTSFLVGR
jgi:hypothetical protein